LAVSITNICGLGNQVLRIVLLDCQNKLNSFLPHLLQYGVFPALKQAGNVGTFAISLFSRRKLGR
jgi:hypothetical protein